MTVNFEPIGFIKTPHKVKAGVPIQSVGASAFKGTVFLNPEYIDGLKDLDGFSHIILIYHFHKSNGFKLQTKPFLDEVERGVFATRAPKRPNSIGISVVKLLRIENNKIEIENVDMLDGTPLLDIKPYVPDFDVFDSKKCGWIDKSTKNINLMKSDDRFS